MAELPVHFFTIVLNGEPFMRYHLERFLALPFDWHWHVVEGVASLTHDTAWSVANGGRVPQELHRNGLSCDGTSEYLDEIVRRHPDKITVYRKEGGAFWDGKREMVAAPLASLDRECLLWQVDGDELWTVEQISLVRELFLQEPERTSAFFYCDFFVGERLLLTTRGTYGNNPLSEWLRCWRFLPGCSWLSHEPPRLCRQGDDGSWLDLATVNPFSHAETEAYGLRFQHFAYVTPEQLRFKEIYYGYGGACQQWQALQMADAYPVQLKNFFSWVTDGTLADTASSQGVQPLAQRDAVGEWCFLTERRPLPHYGSCHLLLRKTWFRCINLVIRVKNKGKILKAVLRQALEQQGRAL